MTLSDILTILGLIAAIIAFVSEKTREYLFLKFSRFDIILFGLGFILINYLTGYEWFRSKGWYQSHFIINGWPVAAVWAYLITLFLLGYLFYRIYYGFFPQRNIEQVILYYKGQLIKSEFSFLVSLIEKIHKKHIIEYLKEVEVYEHNNTKGYSKLADFEEFYKNVLNTKEKRYGRGVYYEIITNEVLIDNIANTHPYFFIDFISHLSNNQLANQDFIFKYLSILIENNNYHLIRELKNTQRYNQLDRSSTGNRILAALFKNIKVAELNSAWQPYGKLTCSYLEDEKANKSSVLRQEYLGDENEFWQSRIYQSIRFFEIMLQEAIAQNLQSHMWLAYFKSFTKGLIENIPEDAGDLINGSSIQY